MFFVVNEHAGNGRALHVFQRIRPLLSAGDEIATTQGIGDGRRLAADAARAGHALVVAVGGDGTANEVVNGLAECGFRPALGVIPAGGGNDLAYSLRLPTDPERALEVLRRGSFRAIDLALVSFDGGDRRRYYVNVLGMGLSGVIAALTRGKKRLGGPLTYGALLLAEMFRVKPVRFELSADGEPVCQSAIAAHLANGRREGRIFPVAPGALLDDGLLDLTAVEDVPRPRRPGSP
ncbi:MAG TPA: diacylglycerol kinase family protein [Dehalococcoidia bacterium]|nr:diacylglycerol kinase family protein [Dehalococcoidia bacterium]